MTMRMLELGLLLSIVASLSQAVPRPGYLHHATHGPRFQRRGVDVHPYFPSSTYKTYGADGVPHHSLRSLGKRSMDAAALDFVKTELGVADGNVGYRDGYQDGNMQYAYINFYHHGIPFINSGANVAFMNGTIVSFGVSAVNASEVKFADAIPKKTWKSLLPQLEKKFDASFNKHPPTLAWYALPDDTAALVHVIQLENDREGIWVEAYADAHSGKVVSVTNFVAHASYAVYPLQEVVAPFVSSTIVDPQDTSVSPLGWHNSGDGVSTTTTGNNVRVYKGYGQYQRPGEESSAGQNFDYHYDPSRSVRSEHNIQSALTDSFYVMNAMHDFTYRYGFTESAFNFQHDNFGKGGQSGDPVIVTIQDPGEINNAFFGTPPDGQSGRATMHLWTYVRPMRDSAVDNSILIHEITHGITNRMTGGGTARCLQTLEAGGLGEGWSDAMADWLSQTDSTIDDFVLSVWASGNSNGIRSYPYSTSKTVNPLMYSNVKTFTGPHAIGEVWANMLHNLHADLVAKHGFTHNAPRTPNGNGGNVIFMHLFMDGLALQPCNPTFRSARDAILQADMNRYGGVNHCLIWTAFARRGLGTRADDQYNDDNRIPAVC